MCLAELPWSQCVYFYVLFWTLKNHLELVLKYRISFLYYEAYGAFTMKHVVKSIIIKQFPVGNTVIIE